MRIIRLLEDYIPEASKPPHPNHIPRYKRDLLIEVDDSKDGWLLLKRMEAADPIASWVPSNLATEAQPGLYRLRLSVTTPTTPATAVAQGELVRIIDTKYSEWYLQYSSTICLILGSECDDAMQQWKAMLLDGTNRTVLLRPPFLETVDVELPPGVSRESMPREPWKNLTSYLKWGHRHTTREPHEHGDGLPPYDQNSRGVTEEKRG